MEMLEEYERQMPGSTDLIRLNLIRMMILMMRETFQTIITDTSPSVSPLKTQRTKLIEDILSYLNQNYASRISLEQIAKNVFMSPSYICKIFKQELLQEEGYSVKEIACLVGYEDIYQFSKLFKKYYGVAPSYFRIQG